MALKFQKMIFLKQLIATGLCIFSTLPLWAQAHQKDNDWVVAKSAKKDATHFWSSSILYADQKKHKPSVCALDYQVISGDGKVAHPFVFLVSRMSREFWTTDRAWNLTGQEDAQLTLITDQQKHVFDLDPENEHIFMTLIKDEEIDAILGQLEKAKKAEIKLAARAQGKDVSLPLKGISPVLDSFRDCISAPEIAYGKKPSVKVDPKLPEVFKE